MKVTAKTEMLDTTILGSR